MHSTPNPEIERKGPVLKWMYGAHCMDAGRVGITKRHSLFGVVTKGLSLCCDHSTSLSLSLSLSVQGAHAWWTTTKTSAKKRQELYH